MAKLGWVAFGLLAAALSIGAAIPRPDHEDEVLATLKEVTRIYRMDAHPRVYKGHPIYRECDFGNQCGLFEAVSAFHQGQKVLGRPYHDFGPECLNPSACKKQEDERLEKLKK